jgi:hypothetical protein
MLMELNLHHPERHIVSQLMLIQASETFGESIYPGFLWLILRKYMSFKHTLSKNGFVICHIEKE